MRRIVETGLLPPGALQLVCGHVGDLFDHLKKKPTPGNPEGQAPGQQ